MICELSKSYIWLFFRYAHFSKQVILIDTLGLLAHVYSMGTHAYVGGGFKRGVHSVLEPAAYNCLIACGPNIEMLDEAKLLKDRGYLTIIKTPVDLTVFTTSTGIGPNLMNNVSAIASDMIDVLFSDSSDNFNIPIIKVDERLTSKIYNIPNNKRFDDLSAVKILETYCSNE